MKTLIIAEAGVNHNGDFAIARKLIKSAIQAGADIVKFQTFSAENLSTDYADLAEYQKRNTSSNKSQKKLLEKLELTRQEFVELNKDCIDNGIEFLSTGFDLESLDFVWALNSRRVKIPSGELTNLPYLRKVGSYGAEVILSTGMANMREIEFAVNALENSGTMRKNIILLHCTTNYPTEMHEVNLNAMQNLGMEFGVRFGYSDHTLGIEVSIAAVTLGACVIEKHFTLDRNLMGPDHRASLEPDELKSMVTSIRNIEIALGDGIKKPTNSEIENARVARKSIVARCNINVGEIFTEENLTTKRPGVGINPMEWDSIIGKSSTKFYQKDDLIER